MCSEALAVFGVTRLFFASKYISREVRYGHWPRPKAMLNPLVFNACVVRNILTSGEMQLLYHGVGDATREFLRKLKQFNVHDICLETSWIRAKRDNSWDVREARTYGKWSDFWNGKCWKVQIIVMARLHADEALSQLSNIAERCAQRLVGGDAAEAIWFDLETTVVEGWIYNRRRVVMKGKA